MSDRSEYNPTDWSGIGMNAEEGREAGRLIAEGFAQGMASARPLVPAHITQALRDAMEPGPLTRYLLRHQHQEFTDTTAAYEAGEDVVPGDCWRACLASLLEVPLAEVPHFIHLYGGGIGAPGEAEESRWWDESVAWVQAQRPGWTLMAWDRDGFPFPFYLDPEQTKGAPDRLIITGPSPRGAWNHSALYMADDGTLDHDPFPDGGGVLPGHGDVAALVRPEWLVS